MFRDRRWPHSGLMGSCPRASKREWPALALKWTDGPLELGESRLSSSCGFRCLKPLALRAKSEHQASTTAGTSCISSASE